MRGTRGRAGAWSSLSARGNGLTPCVTPRFATLWPRALKPASAVQEPDSLPPDVAVGARGLTKRYGGSSGLLAQLRQAVVGAGGAREGPIAALDEEEGRRADAVNLATVGRSWDLWKKRVTS